MKKEKPRLPLIYSFITGAIGKDFVIKQYKYGTVKTKYPDMSRVVASTAQRKCRDLFREAVAYAKTIMADPMQKAAWLKKVRHKCKVFPMIVRHYLQELKAAAVKRKNATKRLIRKCFNPGNLKEVPAESGVNSCYELKEVLNDHH